jgi:hypothetical protein
LNHLTVPVAIWGYLPFVCSERSQGGHEDYRRTNALERRGV